MARIMILIGISGSGKSTYAKDCLKNKNFDLWLSSDEYRAKLLGDVNDQSRNSYIFEELHKDLRKATKENKNIIYDATNLNRKKRISLIKQIKSWDKDAIVEAACIIAPLRTCIARRSISERKVDMEVIIRQASQFQVPLTIEGFNFIQIIQSDTFSVGSLLDRFYEMSYMNHNNPHHPNSTIMSHACEVEAAWQRFIMDSEEDMTQFAGLGLFHDIGKIYTKTLDDKGIAHYYNHAGIGAWEWLCFNKNTLGTLIIEKHMEIYGIKGDKETYYRGLEKYDERLPLLMQFFNIADKARVQI